MAGEERAMVGEVAVVVLPSGCAKLEGGTGGVWIPARDRTAVAQALLPPGTVPVDAERLAALEEYRAACEAQYLADAAGTWSHQDATRFRLAREAFGALSPGDGGADGDG